MPLSTGDRVGLINRTLQMFKEIVDKFIDKFTTKLAVAVTVKLQPFVEELIESQMKEAKGMMTDQLEKADEILDKKIAMIEAILKNPKTIKKLLGFL